MMDFSDAESRMKKTLEVMHGAFAGIRTGRATPSLLEPVKVDAYEQKMPLNQLASISVAEARTLTVQVWDAAMVASVEKALRESELGLNPMTDGQMIRLTLPELSQERRVELSRLAAKYAEQARVSIRNVRRDALDKLKKQEKDGDISKDDAHQGSEQMQKMTDTYIQQINESLTRKEQDITNPQ
ncbi:MAG: ribosome recycling factor [Alphaproteobacteria bacterium GM202ARS2]|nr:ribosome recycling factor [Alphaproteobacteria bacterium GM202ARS2]